jgi:hypothetical protein
MHLKQNLDSSTVTITEHETSNFFQAFFCMKILSLVTLVHSCIKYSALQSPCQPQHADFPSFNSLPHSYEMAATALNTFIFQSQKKKKTRAASGEFFSLFFPFYQEATLLQCFLSRLSSTSHYLDLSSFP